VSIALELIAYPGCSLGDASAEPLTPLFEEIQDHDPVEGINPTGVFGYPGKWTLEMVGLSDKGIFLVRRAMACLDPSMKHMPIFRRPDSCWTTKVCLGSEDLHLESLGKCRS